MIYSVCLSGRKKELNSKRKQRKEKERERKEKEREREGKMERGKEAERGSESNFLMYDIGKDKSLYIVVSTS